MNDLSRYERSSHLRELARVAHRIWCERMVRAGWAHGLIFDATHLVHDALIEFDLLGSEDQDEIMVHLEAMDAPRLVAEYAELDRSSERPFRLAELSKQVNVQWSPQTEVLDPTPAKGSTGKVDSWETVDGKLTLIRVLWSDGTRTEHDPHDHALIRSLV